jgi:NAD-dependent DNA ligase
MKELSMEEEKLAVEYDKFAQSMLEFEDLQRELLKHKYLYYVKTKPIISDYDYDMLEVKSRKLAKQLGFRADEWEGPEENEKDHVHWMVDFDENHPLAASVIKEVDGE